MAKIVTKDTLTSVVNTVSNSYIKNIDVTSRIMTPAEIIGVCEIIDPYYQFQQPLTLNILTDGSLAFRSWTAFGSFSLLQTGVSEIHYKKNDDAQWSTLSVGQSISVVTGDKVYLGYNNYYSSLYTTTVTISGVGSYTIHYFPEGSALQLQNGATATISGNIMSLINEDNFKTLTALTMPGQFAGLFYRNTGIVSVSELLLPATTLTDACYSCMFYNITSATSGLTDASLYLPATNLSTNAYVRMFTNNKSLISAPNIAAEYLSSTSMVSMFERCSSLETAPELHSETLADYSYAYLFSGCSSLNTVKSHAINMNGTNPLYNWLNNVAASGTFYKDSTATYTSDSSGIPDGWTIINM